jgi:molybdate transport system regulatory protein
MPKQNSIDAFLALRSDGRLLVGRDRIAVLEAVSQHGSLTSAAKALGYSYKAAWDAIAAINNLLPTPAVISRAGGTRGGGALVTEEGHRLIIAFRRLEEKLSRISNLIAEEGLEAHPDLLFWSVAMKTSARNVFRCTVTEIRPAPVDVVVTLRVSEQFSIVAVITNESVIRLELAPGRQAIALVKASFVTLTPPEADNALSEPNRIAGVVVQRIDGGINAEITLDIGFGKTLVSVISQASAASLVIAPGDRLCGTFSPDHVILAAD